MSNKRQLESALQLVKNALSELAGAIDACDRVSQNSPRDWRPGAAMYDMRGAESVIQQAKDRIEQAIQIQAGASYPPLSCQHGAQGEPVTGVEWSSGPHETLAAAI